MTQFTTNIWRKEIQRYDTVHYKHLEKGNRDMTQFTTNIWRKETQRYDTVHYKHLEKGNTEI